MRKWAADAALLGVAFVWGATFVLVQKAIAKLPPFSFLAVRFTLAALCLWAIGRLLGQKARADRRSLAAGAVLGVWLFGGYALQTLGLLWTTPARAGFITGLSVVLVPLFSWLILHHRPTVPAWAGAGLAAAGLYLLTGAGEEIFRLFKDGSSAELATLSIAGSVWNRGDTLVLMCALCFACKSSAPVATRRATTPWSLPWCRSPRWPSSALPLRGCGRTRPTWCRLPCGATATCGWPS
jgi:Predicted membrane protein